MFGRKKKNVGLPPIPDELNYYKQPPKRSYELRPITVVDTSSLFSCFNSSEKQSDQIAEHMELLHPDEVHIPDVVVEEFDSIYKNGDRRFATDGQRRSLFAKFVEEPPKLNGGVPRDLAELEGKVEAMYNEIYRTQLPRVEGWANRKQKKPADIMDLQINKNDWRILAEASYIAGKHKNGVKIMTLDIDFVLFAPEIYEVLDVRIEDCNMFGQINPTTASLEGKHH